MKLVYLCVLTFSFSVFAQSKIVVNVGLSPAGSFQAVSTKVKGQLKLTGSTIESDKISVLIESFKTEIDLRDEHFVKHLNSGKHPKATITKLKAQDGKGTAQLELNGVTVPISVKYETIDGLVKANFKVKAADFKLSKAQYLGVGVDDEVVVDVEMPLK